MIKEKKTIRDMTQKIISIIAITFVFMIIVSFYMPKADAAAGAYSDTSPVTCEGDCSWDYELSGFTEAQCEENPIDCFNTIDECMDGHYDLGDYITGSEYEWVEVLTVTSLNGTNFTGNGSIEIYGIFKCDVDGDTVAFAYNNGSGWRNVYNGLCEVEDYVEIFYTLPLDDIRGNHSVRGTIVYGAHLGVICGYDINSMYSDTDDVSFYVNSEHESTPPAVTNLRPDEGTAYEFIIPKTIRILADVTDDISVDSVFANITWGEYNTILPLAKENITTWAGDFVDANITGRYNISIIANDTSGNTNNAESTFFYFNKTTDITLVSPTNERWYPTYNLMLDYILEVTGSILSTGYYINEEEWNYVTTKVSENNNFSNAPESYENSSGKTNISQSINLTERLNVTRISLKIKGFGQGKNLTLQIRNGTASNPGDEVLGETNTSEPPSNLTASWIDFNFSVPIPLGQDTTYWLVLNTTGNPEDYVQIETNNGTYQRGMLLSNNSFDISFIIEDGYHYRENITVPVEDNDITAFAELDGEATLFYSPLLKAYVDRQGPGFSQLIHSPTTSSDIDPGQMMNITINITDVFNVSYAIFQYKRADDSLWTNVTMQNISDTYYANFTPDSEGNWTIRVIASDTLGNLNTTQSTIINASYERTFLLNSSGFNETIGSMINTNTSLGSIEMNNTGDTNLTITLRRSEAVIPEVYFNDTRTELNFTLRPDETLRINITATALSVQSTSRISIEMITKDNDIMIDNRTINSTLASYLSGPYFIVNIKQYDPLVTQGDERIYFEAEIMNAGNETAENTTLYWTLPQSIVSKDNVTKNITSFEVGEKYNFKITSSILTDAPAGNVDIIITARNNITNSSDSRTITINSISVPATASSTKSSTIKMMSSVIEIGNPEIMIGAPSLIEIVRGKNASFEITIINNETKDISNITLTLTNYQSAYTKIEKTRIDMLAKGGNERINITLEAPIYMNEGKYTVMIQALVPWNEKMILFEKEMTLVITNPDTTDTLDCIIDAENKAEELKASDYNTEKIDQMIEESRNSILSKEYEIARSLCDNIQTIISYAKETRQELESIERTEAYIIRTSDSAYESLSLAKEAFDKGDFELAKARTADAKVILTLEKRSFNQRIRSIGSAMIEKWYILAIAAIFSAFLYSRLSIGYSRKKITDLEYEEKITIELIKKAQRQRFIGKEIGHNVYEKYMEKYTIDLAKIQKKKNILRLDIMRMQGKGRKDSLQSQLDLVTDFKKEIQEEFFVKKIIGRKSYDLMMKEYEKIISDLNEELCMVKR